MNNCSMFNEVYKFLNILLTILATFSSAQCTFSTFRRLTAFLRSTVTQPHLNSHKDKTNNVDLNKIPKELCNERRWNFWGEPQCFFP